jgi:hypothetical protein
VLPVAGAAAVEFGVELVAPAAPVALWSEVPVVLVAVEGAALVELGFELIEL